MTVIESDASGRAQTWENKMSTSGCIKLYLGPEHVHWMKAGLKRRANLGMKSGNNEMANRNPIR